MSIGALVWVGLLIAIYIGTYLWNKNTPKPEGCDEVLSGCSGCNDISCSHNAAYKKEEENNGN